MRHDLHTTPYLPTRLLSDTAAADPQQPDPILCVGACGDYATGADLLCDDCRADWEIQERGACRPPDPHADVVLDVDESGPCDHDPLKLWD